MSEIKEYIDSSLESEYTQVRVLSETAVNKLTLYKHNKCGKQIVLIKSAYRNDDVFRKLKAIDTNGYIPLIYEVCSEEDYLYVVEEYIDGTPLIDYLERDAEINEKEVCSYLIDVCSALEIIHSLGIVHRDIKPENVIVRDGKACLIDYSVAKIMSYSQQDTVNLGTAGYAAPEQYGITESKPTSDIYALGVLANVMLTGEHPATLIPTGKIGKIIRKCTNIQITKRYQSAGELKKQLMKV